jgi:type I restriction enzyme S subunit
MSEWKEVRFDEIGDVFSGGTPSTTNPELWDGNLAFVTPYDLSKNKTPYIKKTQRYITQKGLEQSSANLLPANNLILSSRAPIGYIALSETEFVTNQGCKSLKFFENQEPLFHYYNLQMYVDKMKRFGVGTTFSEISKGDLAKLKIQIPKEKKEQKRIAHILTTCDTVIEQTQLAIAKYKAIKQGLLHDLFTRGLDSNGRLRPSYPDAPELYKPSELGMIPKEWEVKRFGDFVNLIHGFQFRDYDFTENGIPIVKIGQIKPENLDLSNCTFISKDRIDEFKSIIIRNGDVLMALTGATLGKACQVKKLKNDVLQNYRVGRFEPKNLDEIHKGFLYYTLTSRQFLNQVFSKVNAGAQGNIGKSDFEKPLFKMPDFNEQLRIFERLESLNHKIESEETLLQKYQSIKRGLMGDLLGGRKEVTN